MVPHMASVASHLKEGLKAADLSRCVAGSKKKSRAGKLSDSFDHMDVYMVRHFVEVLKTVRRFNHRERSVFHPQLDSEHPLIWYRVGLQKYLLSK